MIPMLVAVLLAAGAPADTVFTADGGRVVGTVLEESPSSGVTLQLPDGSMRRIDAAQVVRVEYSDGTVSATRAAPAPAAAPAPPPPAPPSEGPPDTVFFTGGGRARGTVIEEDPKTGVRIRLIGGALQTYPPEAFTRIEYADGTVSNRKVEAAPVAPPPPRPEPAVGAPIDTLFFVGGGRVRGTVIEESPTTGVRIRQLDGTLRSYQRAELVRIEYADGSVSRRKAPPPPPQPVAVPPPPPPSPALESRPPLFPLYLTLGVGATFLGGNAELGVPVDQLFETQAHVSSEFGLRLGPAWAIGVYGDFGGGDLAAPIRGLCPVAMMDCMGTTGRWGILLRRTWDPHSPTSKWLSFGTGWESASLSVDQGDQALDVFTYSGRELFRLGAGIDFRSNQVLGVGFYGSISWGEYDEYRDATGTYRLDPRTHSTGQVGIRLTLFP